MCKSVCPQYEPSFPCFHLQRTERASWVLCLPPPPLEPRFSKTSLAGFITAASKAWPCGRGWQPLLVSHPLFFTFSFLNFCLFSCSSPFHTIFPMLPSFSQASPGFSYKLELLFSQITAHSMQPLVLQVDSFQLFSLFHVTQRFFKKKKKSGLPWWRSGWESACQCRGHGFEPWSGKIPHAAEQLGPWATITEPAHLEPVLRNKRGRDGERPAHRDEEWPLLATTREGPRTETKTQHSH